MLLLPEVTRDHAYPFTLVDDRMRSPCHLDEPTGISAEPRLLALIEYTREYHAGGLPPAPVVYWHAHDATTEVFAIQYWMYSVFDQFTVNFHWHDWELLQVFIDAESVRRFLSPF